MPRATLITTHHILLAARKPCSQFLRFRRICSDDDQMSTWLNPRKLHRFFENRGYPCSVVTSSQRRTQEISLERALGNCERGDRARYAQKVPLVFTYHPKNQEVKKLFLKNFRILTDDPSLCAFIGGMQVSETSWFITHCRLALIIPKPHQREHFIAIDPGAAQVLGLHGKDGNGHKRQRRC